MEMVSLKLDKKLLDDMDKNLHEFHFSTRTEFIRAAIRKQLEELRIKKAILDLKALPIRKKVDANYEQVREEVFQEIARSLKK